MYNVTVYCFLIVVEQLTENECAALLKGHLAAPYSRVTSSAIETVSLSFPTEDWTQLLQEERLSIIILVTNYSESW
jgi:hypothetical protein